MLRFLAKIHGNYRQPASQRSTNLFEASSAEHQSKKLTAEVAGKRRGLKSPRPSASLRLEIEARTFGFSGRRELNQQPSSRLPPPLRLQPLVRRRFEASGYLVHRDWCDERRNTWRQVETEAYHRR